MAKFDVQSPAAEAGRYFEEMVGQMHLQKHGPQMPGLDDVMKQLQSSVQNYASGEPSRPSLKEIAAAKGGGVEI